MSTIGKHTYGERNISIKQWGEGANLHIGSFCSIADNITIFLGGNHNTEWISTYPFGHINTKTFNTFDGKGHPSTNGDVVIRHDVWIGSGVTIMSGVYIGEGAVIAANSHVVKDVAPYTIVGGNPAKLIKKRFADNVVEQLLELKWWDLPDDKINQIAPLLCSDNIEELISKLKQW